MDDALTEITEESTGLEFTGENTGVLVTGTVVLETGGNTGDTISQLDTSNIEENTMTNMVNNDLSDECRKEGEIALTREDDLCCEGLNRIYYRGQQANVGAICFNAHKGVPACSAIGTSSEGWYYPDGILLMKDLACGDYFSSESQTTTVTTDESVLKTILRDLFN
ncbi:MAG: hypothetical protein GXP45_05010 [bacterium]|nr:hypothetical protein [bacterium]